MSNTAKVIVTIVVILVILGGIYWWLVGQNGPVNPPVTTTGNNAAAGTGASALASGNSNADLNQDLATIDGQIGGFSSDAVSINQAMNDQPVTQSQL